MAPGFAGLFDNLRAPEHLCSLSGFFFENLSDPSPDRRSGASSQETLNSQPDFSFSGPGGGGFHGDSLNYLLFRPVPELSSRGFPFADDQPLLPDHLERAERAGIGAAGLGVGGWVRYCGPARYLAVFPLCSGGRSDPIF